MTKVQFITTPGGGELAVLPRAEFERLVELAEDAEDEAALAQARSERASGAEETIPFEMHLRISGGENPVRVWREHRGMSLAEVAAAAGVSAAYLSQIETGKREGTLATMRRIAAALNLSLDDLVPAATE